jgi:hypothetical protein
MTHGGSLDAGRDAGKHPGQRGAVRYVRGVPEKIALDAQTDLLPRCPWCEVPLQRIAWHKIRGGPTVGYLVVLSCGICRGMLDALADTPRHASAG